MAGFLALALLALAAPRAVAGFLFVSSTATNQILKYDDMTGAPVGTGIFVPAGSAGLSEPQGLAFGPNGNLLVVSTATSQILEFDGKTGAPVGTGVFVAAGSAGLSLPTGIVFGPNGNLYVASSDRILEFNGTTGAPVGTGVLASVGRPDGLAFGPNGNLFVATPGNQILQFTGATGALVGTFVPAFSAGMQGPRGIAFGPNGNLYVADTSGGQILEFDGTTGAPVGTGILVPGGVPNNGGLSIPIGLTFGPNGNLFVASEGSNRVVEYDSTTGATIGNGIFVADQSAGLRAPTWLAFGPPAVSPVPAPPGLALAAAALCLAGYAWRRPKAA